jgi:ferric-dicitrate binding protein FerR (iron transport regulator)
MVAILLHLLTKGPDLAPPDAVTRKPDARRSEDAGPIPESPLLARSKAELEAARAKYQEAIAEIERKKLILQEAKARPATPEERQVQQDQERTLEVERHEKIVKLVRTEEDLARPVPTRVAPPAPASGPILEAIDGEVAWTGEAGRPAQPGDAVAAGAGLVTRGPRSRAVLRLPDETRIELHGDSRLDAIQAATDQKTFTLTLGSLGASVTKQPALRSVIFLTPHAEMTVLGTRLLLAVGPEETRLDVEEGRVRNRRLSDRKSIDVPANHTVTTARSGPLVAKPLPVVRSFQDGVLPTPDYAGTRDTSIGNAAPTAVSGSMDLLRLYREPKGDLQNTTLIRWDVSSIPRNSRVVSVDVSFWVTGALSVPGARIFEIRRPWEEAEASWKFTRNGIPWQLPGARGDQDSSPKPLAMLSPSVNGWSSFPLNDEGVALVQRWVNAPTLNFGFGVAKEPPNAWDLASREWATPEHRPKLTVSYLPPAK